MSNPTTAPAAEPTQATTDPAEPTQGDPAEEQLGEGGKKALQAERDRAKELEKQLNAATARLTEFERATETETQRLQREAQEAREALPAGITAAFRDAAVTFGGIAAEDAELFLTGTDVDTLKKQAARLVERTPTSPLPDPTQGGGGSPLALNSDGLEEALRSKLGI